MLSKLIDIILHLDKYLGTIIQDYGVFVYLFLFLVFFTETGLVIAPFLPGDSLLFVAGTFAGIGSLNLYALLITLSAAVILGDTINYWLGSYFGEKLFSRLIKKEHMEKTKIFYEKHGKKTIALARFVPIIRTFAPFVAGIGKMNYWTFLGYNVLGGIAWIFLFVFAGYFFGNIPIIEKNLSLVILLIIAVSLIPLLREYLNHKNFVIGAKS